MASPAVSLPFGVVSAARPALDVDNKVQLFGTPHSGGSTCAKQPHTSRNSGDGDKAVPTWPASLRCLFCERCHSATH